MLKSQHKIGRGREIREHIAHSTVCAMHVVIDRVLRE